MSDQPTGSSKRRMESNGFWKIVATALIAIVGSLGLALTMTSGAVTREGVSKQIKVESPYIEDKKDIQSTMKRLTDDSESIQREQRVIQEKQAGMDVKLDLIIQKLD